MPGRKAQTSSSSRWREGYRKSVRISGFEASQEMRIEKQKGKRKLYEDDGSSDRTDHVYDRVTQQEPPLPEKHVLELILDTLQRRDTYEIFGEPVDPEKVEDYYRIIQEPMDFGTMRAKLHEGMYTSFQQFEYDVFLITRNAMHFNPSNTAFYKQALAMDELAKKVFHLFKSNPEGFKQQLPDIGRKLPRRSSRPEIRSSANELIQKTANLRPGSAKANEPSSKTSLPSRVAACRRSVKGNQFTQTKRLVSDRRSTYQPQTPNLNENDSFFTTPLSNIQVLVQVKQQDIGYRESLMQFAKNLGPTVEKIARVKLLGLSLDPPNQLDPSNNPQTEDVALPSTNLQFKPGPIHAETLKPAPKFADWRDAQKSHSRVVVLALPCSGDMRKKAANNFHNPSTSTSKKMALLDSRCEPNMKKPDRNDHVILPLGSRTSQLCQASDMSGFMQKNTLTASNTGKAMNLKTSCIALLPPVPQYKFDLQFLQMRLDQMKSLGQESSSVLQGNSHASESPLMDSKGKQQDSADTYWDDLSLRL